MTAVLKSELLAERLRLRKKIQSGGAPQGIVTSLAIQKGEHYVLSRYEDDVWILPDDWFSANVVVSQRKLDFARIQSPALRSEAKLVMFRQMWGVTDASSSLRGSTLGLHFNNLCYWIEWLTGLRTVTHADVTPLLAQRYVDHVRSLKSRIGEKKSLAPATQQQRLAAVEMCWKNLRDTPLGFDHPWPDSSATALAGLKTHRKPSTPIIPEEILAALFQYAESQLERAGELLDHRDALNRLALKSMNRTDQAKEKGQFLAMRGWSDGLQAYHKALLTLRDSCFLLILTTTGIRAHELANIKRDNWFSEVREGERFYFLGSRSDKTYAGETQWICPEIAITAVQVLGRLAEPLQEELDQALEQATAIGNYREAGRLNGISSHVSLCKINQRSAIINVLSGNALILRLQMLTDYLSLDWKLAPHQFRRTFANHVVHHKLGDLRYLRDHFKHWSLDMAALYAFNEAQDLELFDEIYRAFDEKRQSIIGHWLEPDTVISGGMAPYVREMRSRNETVRTYKNRKEMIHAISELIYLRSTGIAWCTNDIGVDCAGGQCEECEHGCIDDTHKPFWRGLYLQQIELRQIDDCGVAGSETVERTIRRCEQVLRDLGVNIEELKERIADVEAV
ncbi:hypothetical protein [Marinobacter salarius]|uniref:hypothetical protein n=1 Tax=Marinobacter salarius TaxID=1420917 RepID=UPI0025A43B8C|nr:hypothetical protein [Marinobacter salarius]MDM8181013.1 hypothetical protein [Marinobacter salarius]